MLTLVTEETFSCPVCLDILNDAIEVDCCQALLCLECAKRCGGGCPTCRRQPLKYRANIPIRRIVLELKESCEQCGEIVLLSERKEHLRNSCPEEMVSCGDCLETMKRRQIDQHAGYCAKQPVICSDCEEEMERGEVFAHQEQTCPNRQVVCGTCTHSILVSEFHNHPKTCPQAIVSCEFCKQDMKRSQLAGHEKSCLQALVKCRHCAREMRRNDLLDHESSCTKNNASKIVCEECGVTVGRKKLANHLANKCQQRMVDCLECGQAVVLVEMKIHSKEQCENRLTECVFCKKKVVFNDREAHWDDFCDQTPVWCDDCLKLIPRSDVWQHKFECPGYNNKPSPPQLNLDDMVMCRHRRCDYKVRRDSLEEHEKKCVYRPIKCSPCGQLIPRFYMGFHEEYCDGSDDDFDFTIDALADDYQGPQCPEYSD